MHRQRHRERAGNAAMDEIVMALRTRGDFYGCTTGINTRQIYRTSKLLSTIIGVGISAQQADRRRERLRA